MYSKSLSFHAKMLPFSGMALTLSLSLSLSLIFASNVYSQTLPSIDPSEYIPNEVLAFFLPGSLNISQIGCYPDTSGYFDHTLGSGSLPISLELFTDENLLSFLQENGVEEITKVVPWLDPCRDTLSITRTGDTIRIPPLWNLLKIRFDATKEINPVMMSYLLVSLFPSSCFWVEPNIILHQAYRKGSFLEAGMVDKTDILEHCMPKTTSSFNDKYLDRQYSLTGDTELYPPSPSLIGIDAISAWNYTTGDSTIKIALIDGGISDEPDFDGSIIHLTPYVPSPYDLSHGTWMAGIIGARSNNSTGIAGIVGGNNKTSGCRIYDYLVKKGSSGLEAGTTISAMTDASVKSTSGVGHGCHILSMSVNSVIPDEHLRYTCALAYNNKVVISACTGDGDDWSNYSYYPADVDNQFVLSVGAKDSIYQRLPYTSNYGEKTDFIAPGCVPKILTLGLNNTTINTGETSAASAHASGIAAMVISELKKHKSNYDTTYSVEDIEGIMKAGCTTIDGITSNDPLNWDKEIGVGLLNAKNSLERLNGRWSLKHYDTITTLNTHIANPTRSYRLSAPSTITFVNTNDTNSFRFSKTTSYVVDQYRVSLTVNYPLHTLTNPPSDEHYTTVSRVWGRGDFDDEGLEPIDEALYYGQSLTPPQYSPIFNVGYTNATNWNSSSCELETFVYHAWSNQIPYTDNWFPKWPDSTGVIHNIRLYYSVLGKLDTVTTNIDEPKQLSINVFPNPCGRNDKYLHVSINRIVPDKNAKALIYDSWGRTVRSYNTNDLIDNEVNTYRIFVGDLHSGVYRLAIIHNNIMRNVSFVIIR